MCGSNPQGCGASEPGEETEGCHPEGRGQAAARLPPEQELAFPQQESTFLDQSHCLSAGPDQVLFWVSTRHGRHGTKRCAIGNGRPKPKAREVIFKPGGACLRLYSFRSTRRATSLTSARSKP